MRKIIFIAVLFSIATGCKKEDALTAPFIGKWVQVSSSCTSCWDTLSFSENGSCYSTLQSFRSYKVLSTDSIYMHIPYNNSDWWFRYEFQGKDTITIFSFQPDPWDNIVYDVTYKKE